ncbi:MAG: hypothetical protein QG635_1669, partial [Bacteroidota bacterium]|nr:hypothetical protein [Bacteroidota bacterium]
EYIDTFYTKKRWSDGLSLFFLARQYIFSNKHIVVPTIMSRDTSPTYLHFIGKIEPIEIESVKYPIKTVYFTGRADWNGIYGLSGNFEGWFSADDARVPIKAKMKVYIGNVVVELKRWKRQNWSPPRID